MPNSILPADETNRLDALRALLILDTPPEKRFDQVTQLAAHLFNVPIALISLVDENRQWFKSRHGTEATQTPRDISFCAHAILGDEALVVPDTLNDARFHDNPLVTGEPNIRFYAGAPLHMKNGMKVGTLCIIDKAPRNPDTEQIALLQDLARIVSSELQGIEAQEDFFRFASRCCSPDN